MNIDTTQRFRRKLPHLRLDGGAYFVTWRLLRGQPLLVAGERNIVQNAVLFFQGERYDAVAGVIMDDHVHAIVQPFSEHSLESVLHSWKSFTANRLQKLYGRVGSVWQPESYDRIVRDEQELMDTMRYIRMNPWKRWPEIDAYPWMWPQESD